jgi:hypothetical protein
MNRARVVCALIVIALVGSSYSLQADVRSDQRSRVEFAGMLGRMFNMFGGKAAREGTTSTVAVRGDRKATLNDSTGQIIDLAEEKIYDIDVKKKSYKVTTFAELRRQMEEARKKAEEDARKQQPTEAREPSKPSTSAPPEQQVEVDFDVKETGEKKAINGFNTRQVIMTITVREKGKTLEQSGGMVTKADMWLTPTIAAMKEVAAFDLKYAQKLYGSNLMGVSAEQMAAAVAMYPMMKPSLDRMNKEGAKMDGTAILTTMTMEAVKSAEQIAQESKQAESSSSSDSKTPTSVGGLLGGFGKKMAAKKVAGNEDPNKKSAAFMTSTTEVLKVVTDVSAADVAVPPGFKESK